MAAKEPSFPPWFERISSLGGVAFVFAVYGLIHSVVTRSVGPALALDDVKLNVVTQSLQAGYLRENPPLFEWLLIAVQSVAGPTLISFLIVKYGLMIASGILAFLVAKELFADKRWAALTAFTLILFYQIGWNYHQAFTHTLTLIAATLLFWWALIRLVRTRSIYDYVFLGLALGLGLLSKYSFAGVAAAALVAVGLRPATRRVLFTPNMFISLCAASVVAWPHIHWLLAQNNDVASDVAVRLKGGADPHWRRAVEGVPAALWAIVSFFLPFALIAAAVFQRSILRRQLSDEKAILVRNASIIGAAGLLAIVVIVGIPSLQERYVIAFLLPAVFWVMALIKNAEPNTVSISRYLMALVTICGFMMGLRIVQTATPGEPFCSDCRQWIPYDAIFDTLNETGFERGTLVGFTDHTAGNLRRLYPKARVISSHMPFYTPPGGALEDDCYFIWSDELGPSAPEAVTSRFMATTTYEAIGDWRHFAKPDGWRRTKWKIAKVNHDPNLTRAVCRPMSAESNPVSSK